MTEEWANYAAERMKVLERALADTQEAAGLLAAKLAEYGVAPELVEGARRVLARYAADR